MAENIAVAKKEKFHKTKEVFHRAGKFASMALLAGTLAYTAAGCDGKLEKHDELKSMPVENVYSAKEKNERTLAELRAKIDEKDRQLDSIAELVGLGGQKTLLDCDQQKDSLWEASLSLSQNIDDIGKKLENKELGETARSSLKSDMEKLMEKRAVTDQKIEDVKAIEKAFNKNQNALDYYRSLKAPFVDKKKETQKAIEVVNEEQRAVWERIWVENARPTVQLWSAIAMGVSLLLGIGYAREGAARNRNTNNGGQYVAASVGFFAGVVGLALGGLATGSLPGALIGAAIGAGAWIIGGIGVGMNRN